jgi:hypothetical protein
MNGALTLAAVALLAGSSWTLGKLALAWTSWPELRAYERAALRLTAGLGLTAIVLSLTTLAGWFSHVTAVVGSLAAIGVALACRDAIGAWRARHREPVPHAVRIPHAPVWVRLTLVAVGITAGLACFGAIAPVTDDDSLAYVMPIARHISESGALRVWSDQSRAMWPQSQQVLLAFLLQFGGDRLGALSALEWLLSIGVLSALARRVCERSEHIGAALILAIGAPVTAFLVSSAKEDLLLLAASTAAAFCLAGSETTGELAIAGLFAGMAAGAKYPGLGVAVAAVAWPVVHWLRGRHSPFGAALLGSAVVALCALASGGLWYALNLSRYGNPVAPFVFGAPGTPLDASVVRQWMDGYGVGRTPMTFLLAPFWIFVDTARFCGRANVYNPLVYAGLAGLFLARARRSNGALFFMAAVLYVGWFLTLQNARLLLPAVVLLAPAAADRLVPLIRRWKPLLVLAGATAAVSLGVVAAVGVLRATRYIQSPAQFLEQATLNYADIQWMNTHLDRRRDRVGSDHKAMGYLEIPWIFLDSSYQLEISAGELADPGRFLAAARRQGLTHLFGDADSFPDLREHLRIVYRNPVSRLGGARFFREPPSESTMVFEIVYPD